MVVSWRGGGGCWMKTLHHQMFWIRDCETTAHKWSLRRLCFYTCLSVHGGWYPSMPCRGVVSQHALQVVSQHSLQVSRGVSRPTPRGEVEGSGQGGSPGPHLGGISRPTPGGVCIPACTEADPPVDGYCRGRYASYWNAFLFGTILSQWYNQV